MTWQISAVYIYIVQLGDLLTAENTLLACSSNPFDNEDMLHRALIKYVNNTTYIYATFTQITVKDAKCGHYLKQNLHLHLL